MRIFKLIGNIIGYLIMVGIIFIFIIAIANVKTDDEVRIELKNKGYNEMQIDSIMKKKDDDLMWSIINLAG